MAYKDLTFLLFAKDMSASRGFEKVAGAADASAVGIKGSMAGVGLAVGAAAIAIGAHSVKMAADFQTATTRLVTDAGESEANLGKVQTGILDISEAVGTSATAIAKGMYYVESAGYHGAAGLEVMRAAAEGAKVGGADMTTVADALTTVMKDYGIQSGKANNTTSQLIATVSRGKTTMEDLAGSLHSVLPNAEAVGISLKQVLGAVATMTQEGISADQATQNLNHTIVSLANPTQVQTKAMAAMGLSSIDVAKNLGKRGLTGTLDDLYSAIFDHMGKSGLVLQDAFNTSKVAAQSADAEMKVMPANLRALAMEYKNGSLSLKDWTTDIKALPGPQANLAKQWAASENAAKGFSQALRSNQGPASTFTGELSKMTGGQTGLQVALHLSGIHADDFKKNVDAIGQASKGTQKNVHDWDTIQHTFNQQMSETNASVNKDAILLGQKLLPALQDIQPAIRGVVHGVAGYATAMTGLYDGGLRVVTSSNKQRVALDGLHGKYGPIIQSAGQLGVAIGKSARIAAADVEGMNRTIGAAFKNSGTWLYTAGHNIIQGLINGVNSKIHDAENTIASLGSLVTSVFAHKIDSHSPSRVFQQFGTYIDQGLIIGLEGSKPQVIAAATRLSNGLITAFDSKQISQSTETSLTSLVRHDTLRLEHLATRRANIAKQLATAQTKLTDAKKTRNDYSSSVASGVIGLGSLTSAQGQTITAADGTTSTAAVTVQDEVARLTTAVSAAQKMQSELAALKGLGLNKTEYDQLVQGFQSTGDTSYADALLAGGKSAVTQVNTLQAQLASVAKSLGTTTSQTMYQAGVDSAQGIVDGLKTRDSALRRSADHIAETLLHQLKKKLDIHSPSRVFHDEVGVQIALGIAGGITSKTKDVNDALTGIVGTPTIDGSTNTAGPGGGRGNLYIEHWHAAPNQSEAELASQLGWQMGQY